jgi:hypothetical protein
MLDNYIQIPIPADERSKVRVCRRSITGIAGSNPAVGMEVCLWRVLNVGN